MSSQRLYSIPWKYDVFLSFRGEDTRKSFTDHLYAALDQKGIIVFRDDKELERGKFIAAELFKAIEESKISIIVFSRTYASSTWCLDELVHILECKRANDQHIVCPIFFDVEPTVVRKQTENFQEAFAQHEEIFSENLQKVQKWRDALQEVASISGWELKDRNESNFILDIVKEVSRKSPIKSEILKNLVGIDSQLEELRFLMDKRDKGARMIGICGMGGIGKTTLARVVYDLISHKFEGSSFLANVRETSQQGGLVSLQKQLLSQLLKLPNSGIWNVYDGINVIGSRLRNRKVLLIIDDVVDIKQLESLAGKREWFGPGSRIIITSRDKHLLITHGVNDVYKLKELHDAEALQLFSKTAFKIQWPRKDYEQLSKWVVKYSGGLPLALKVLGSFLYGKTKEEWDSTLKRLKREPENEILDILQISFDGLKESEKKMFLDIACFYRGEDRDDVTKILDYCDFDPVIGIRVLIDKSLIEISTNNILWMHDLLQEMGRQIVNRQSPEEPGKRSRLWAQADVHHMLTRNTGTETVEAIKLDNNRLWMHDLLQEMGRQIVNRQSPEEPGKRSRLRAQADVHHMLTRNTGTETVEAIKLDNSHEKEDAHLTASSNAFLKMTNLRMLVISNVQLPGGLEYLSNELRFLEWNGYPWKSLPSTFQPNKIVELNLCYSRIEQMWSGIKPLSKLKIMRLSNSKALIRIPDFSAIPNLEELDLGGCTKLCDIHPTLLLHKKVILLNLNDCTSLTTLPGKIFMESLKTLKLSGCLKLKKFPEIVGSMKHLSKLHLNGTGIQELPLSIEFLSGLVQLNLEGCKNLEHLPSTVNGLRSLKNVYLSGCTKLKNVPENMGKIESLEVLDISCCKGSPQSTSWYLPFSINLLRSYSDPVCLRLPSLSGLCSLMELDISDSNLVEEAIPKDIGNLRTLKKLYLSKNSFVTLPESISRLFNLEKLDLDDCRRLQSMPKFPPNLHEVLVNGCFSLETISGALKLCKSKCISILCAGDLKLLGSNGLAYSMLKEYLEAVSNAGQWFCIVVPGTEIPEWFMFQNEGASIRYIMPSNLYCTNKALGYAVCCVFHVSNNSPGIQRCHLHPTHQLNCHMNDCSAIYSIKRFDQAETDHLWLFYLSREECRNSSWSFENNLIELSFRSMSCAGLEVKRCGFHPIYRHNVEFFNQTTNEWTRYTTYNVNEFYPNCV